jgi:5'-3' exonuclease
MKLHVVDGTYELFRSHFGAPPASSPAGMEVGATRGLLRSLWALLGETGVSHVGVAFDHVIESFRNRLFEGYKDGSGIEPDLLQQFPLAERAAHALGLVVWPMVEFEADDAMASAAHCFAESVDQVVLCTPDKDLAQCVRGTRVVMLDRRRRRVIDENGVRAKFGVSPDSIPDYLAVVGDDADGIPGIPRWGAKSAAIVLRHYGSIDRVPPTAQAWAVSPRGAATLSANLEAERQNAQLYRRLATLRLDVPLAETLADLEWRGARRDALLALLEEIGDSGFAARVGRWRDDG